MVVLPTDAAKYGVDPNDLDVSLAVRMSMEYPLFFLSCPTVRQVCVDGHL